MESTKLGLNFFRVLLQLQGIADRGPELNQGWERKGSRPMVCAPTSAQSTLFSAPLPRGRQIVGRFFTCIWAHPSFVRPMPQWVCCGWSLNFRQTSDHGGLACSLFLLVLNEEINYLIIKQLLNKWTKKNGTKENPLLKSCLEQSFAIFSSVTSLRGWTLMVRDPLCLEPVLRAILIERLHLGVDSQFCRVIVL